VSRTPGRGDRTCRVATKGAAGPACGCLRLPLGRLPGPFCSPCPSLTRPPGRPKPPPAAKAYLLSSPCPSDADAAWLCSTPSCPRAGAVVGLDGVCTNKLAGAKVVYAVNGSPATSFTCPAYGRAVTIVAMVDKYGSGAGCSYSAPPIVVAREPERCDGT
jgi:hypothetical protein